MACCVPVMGWPIGRAGLLVAMGGLQEVGVAVWRECTRPTRHIAGADRHMGHGNGVLPNRQRGSVVDYAGNGLESTTPNCLPLRHFGTPLR